LLQLKNIVKNYKIGDNSVGALKGVSINFRETEFVSILGQSGCGKTTLLNIVGGLDRYTSGDLIIDGVSTKQYTAGDWDVYRNHKIGFVFQSYNLIPHQTVLSNVELALTLSGVSKKERRERAIEALKQVGLQDQIHKKPNQMSGGQMQRVAIARALVNDPEILLADEPTGALDSETSIQIMEILKEISKNKLIIMVTHNPEIAQEYSSRIIRLLDGEVISDSDEYTPEIASEPQEKKTKKEKKKKAQSMSFFTALGLSFNNLLTKKARTFLTSFAGSIGIIGIALILAVSNGVNAYIADVQEDTLSSYPITIEAESVNATELMKNLMGAKDKELDHDRDKVYSSSTTYDMLTAFSSAERDKNNLYKFKEYVDKNKDEFGDNLTAVQYGYNLDLNVYTKNIDDEITKSDVTELMNELYGDSISDMMTEGQNTGVSNSSFSMFSTMKVWEEMLPGMDGEIKNDLLDEQYDVIYGNWPKKFDEIVLIVNENNEISDLCLYALGLTSSKEMKDVMTAFMNGEPIKEKKQSWTYKEICDMKFKIILPTDFYSYDVKTKTYKDLSEDETGLKYLYDKGIDLKVTGIIRPNDESTSSMMTGAIGYTSKLTEYVIERAQKSKIIEAQLEKREIDVFTGLPFKTSDYVEPKNDVKADDFKEYAASLDMTDKASLYTKIAATPEDAYISEQVAQVTAGKSRDDLVNMLLEASKDSTEMDPDTLKEYLEGLSDGEFQENINKFIGESVKAQYAEGMKQQLSSIPATQLAIMLESQLPTYSEERLAQFYDLFMPSTVSQATLDENLDKLGYVDLDKPSKINLFSSTFEGKDGVAEQIEKYNKDVDKEDEINYTDYVALLMSSVTTIINSISYVLIAFVAISLIVSSIMIGIITYISVLERTKEIGILRSIGASTLDISRVFNAETMIVGFAAGAIGIGCSLALIILINIILQALTGIPNLNAVLPIHSAFILILISIVLTLISGLVPARIAAKKDPVEALRTE